MKHPKLHLISPTSNAQTCRVLKFCLFLRAFPSVRMPFYDCVPVYSVFKDLIQKSLCLEWLCLPSQGQLFSPLSSQAWSIYLCCDGLFPKMVTIISPIPYNLLQRDFTDTLIKKQNLAQASVVSWFGIFPQTERLLVWFLVRAHAWIAGSVSGWGNQSMFLSHIYASLPLFLPAFLSL